MKLNVILQIILELCFLIYWYLERKERGEREGEKHQFVIPFIDPFIGWFLYVPCPGTEPLQP